MPTGSTLVDMVDPTPPEPVRPVNAAALQRADKAWRARVLGASWAQAALVAGYADDTTAWHAVKNAYGELPKLDREEVRALWRERLEVAWRQSVKDMAEQRPGAVTAGVRVAGAAAALDGLNEPTEVVVSPSAAELEAWVARVLAAQTPQVVEYDIIGGGPGQEP